MASPIKKEEFNEKAQPVTIQIGDKTLVAMPKEFSTGSVGWYLSGKTTIKVGGVDLPVQVGLNITVIGSKPEK